MELPMSSRNGNKPRTERRAADRFPLVREARFSVMQTRPGALVEKSRTVNMSSRGVLFQAESLLHPGKRVELSVSWPARLNDGCALKLVIVGRVARSTGRDAALEIDRYEFHTMGAAGL
jgi:hypothetical protein